MKTVEVLLLKGMVFIRTSNSRRVPLLQEIYGLYAFMTDRSTHRPIVIPDRQMDAFMFMVDRSSKPVMVSTSHFSLGDKVRINTGSMAGLEGELIQVGGCHRLILRLQNLLCAMVEVEASDVEKIS